MKIFKVIHGYPMLYNAGSEVYSQHLCKALAKMNLIQDKNPKQHTEQKHEVHVFTREEDPFVPDYQYRRTVDPDEPRITLHYVNNPRSKDKYRDAKIDELFATLLDEIKPEIVHVGHLNHLSTSLLQQAFDRNIPIIYTLHDYWLMCPRGQFMQMSPTNSEDIWATCDGQENKKCAERCYARYYSGNPHEYAQDTAYWEDWVKRRMQHIREMSNLVECFIAPSQYLLKRYRDEFGIPSAKLQYLDYGFPQQNVTRNAKIRIQSEDFTFGYIGTHIPAKGIHHLIEAFGLIEGTPRLKIWGRHRGQETAALKRLTATLPQSVLKLIEWLPEYKNEHLVKDVFNHCDAIIVPSIWVENSPLVIHEAQQVRMPVITANSGGMAEYVQHDINGLLFKHRSAVDLAKQMQRMYSEPQLAQKLGKHGYLHSANGDIPSIEEHAEIIERIYTDAIEKKHTKQPVTKPVRQGPWRITFDTNPDTCNMRCVMCEEHSPYSPLQKTRRQEGRARRFMPFTVIEKVIADASLHGLQEIIPSTMGEPLLYEHFEQIIDLCHKYKIKLNLTTNGTFHN